MAIGIPYSIGSIAAKAGSVTTATITLTAAVPAGDTILVALMHQSQSSPSRSATDSQGNSYAVTGTSGTSNDMNLAVFSAAALTALAVGDTITLALASAIVGYAASAFGVNGILPTVDRSSSTTGTATGTSITTTLGSATTVADELLFAAAGVRTPSNANPNAGTNYTRIGSVGTTGGSNNTNWTIYPEYRIVAATSAYAAGMSGMSAGSGVDKSILLTTFPAGDNPLPVAAYQDQILDLRAGYSRLPQVI